MPTELLPKTWKNIFEKQTLLPVVVKAIERYHDCEWSMDLDAHDHFEMVYIKRGETTFEVSGEHVTLSPGNILIIKPHQLHKFSVVSTTCEFLVLRFKFTTEHATDVSIEDFLKFTKHTDAAFIHLKPGIKNDIALVMNRIIRENDNKLIWNEYLCYLLIMELFILISRNIKQALEQDNKNRSVKLNELMIIAKEYINNNCCSSISLSDVASYVFLSESYFSHCFKQTFSISPKQYILQARIRHAKNLLANSDTKMCDIAREIGFTSQQRFNDIFKKHEGTTPFKFRKTVKQNKLNTE